MDQASKRLKVPAELDEAFFALLWGVGCDIVTQKEPMTAAQAAARLGYHAARFGLAFTDDGVQAAGEALIEAFGSRPGATRNDAAEACSRIPESGF